MTDLTLERMLLTGINEVKWSKYLYLFRYLMLFHQNPDSMYLRNNFWPRSDIYIYLCLLK